MKLQWFFVALLVVAVALPRIRRRYLQDLEGEWEWTVATVLLTTFATTGLVAQLLGYSTLNSLWPAFLALAPAMVILWVVWKRRVENE